MRGLLLKDLLVLKSYIRTLGGMFAIYLAMGVAWNNVYFFAGMSGILCVMMVMSSFSYDHYAKWDKYGASLPVTRSDMVGAKYLLALVMMGIATVMTVLMYLVFILIRKGDFSTLLPIIFGTTASGVFLMLVLLPCIFKFGPEKARLMLMMAGVMIALLVTLVVFLLPEDADNQLLGRLLLVVIPIAEIVSFYFSYKLSCRIYTQKEL